MATHRESRNIALSAEHLFDVVADVERYPEFLPLVREARVVDRQADGYETEQTLVVGWSLQRFRSCTQLDRPRQITVTARDRSLWYLDIRWDFSPLADQRCRVDFTVDCQARALFLLPLIQIAVLPMATSMVQAFERRAHVLARSGSLPNR